MLVSMVFQTLYVLIDLYWVGRLGTDAVAAVGLSGNLMFIVLAATQMLGVGTTLVSRREHETSHAPTSSSTSRRCSPLVVGVLFVAIMAIRNVRGGPPAPTRARGVWPPVPSLVHPGTRASVRPHRDGVRATRHGQLPSGHGRADGDRDPQHRPCAGLHLPDGASGVALGSPAPRCRRSSQSRSAAAWMILYSYPPSHIFGSRSMTGSRASISGATC